MNEFLLAKARSGRSDRYLRALRNSLTKFALGRARQPIADVSLADVEKFYRREEWAPRTQRGYLSDVQTLFNFAVRRGLLARSPASGAEPPVLPDTAIDIHTPAQVRTALELARKMDLDVCRVMAVR